MKFCFKKTLDMPLLAYYSCSKLLKVRTVFYQWYINVGIGPNLTKKRCTRCAIVVSHIAKYIMMHVSAISLSFLVHAYILLTFYRMSHACANSGTQAVFPSPAKKRSGNKANTKGNNFLATDRQFDRYKRC